MLERIAIFQTKLPNGLAQCNLCPHSCVLRPGQISRCHTRINQDGVLFARSYGMITAIALDPIEKKPLKQFYPGKSILSVGGFGCNLSCDFCQNWHISQQEPQAKFVSPAELLQLVVAAQEQNNIGVAFTYNEPTVWMEYVLDASELVHRAGLKNILVTNGFIQEAPMEMLLPFIDAMNIDLKGFTESFYQETCGGRLTPVMDTIKRCHGRCHIELTTLVIPGKNDADKEIAALTEWIASVSPDIPLHLTRHHPDYRMEEPAPISVSRLQHLAEIARKSLQTVWVGNC